MKRYQITIPAFLILVFIGAVALNLVSASPLLGSGAPTVVSYQGVVMESGTPYTGTGYFKFAVVNAAGDTSYWSNDGTSSGGGEPTDGVSLTVDEGLFQVLLGDTGLTNMTSLSASTFSGTERYLRVWFSTDDITYTLLSPDQQFAAVPYALQAQEAADADTVDGLHASELETHYQNVIIVAKSGGDYTSVQAAIDSITDASASNPYLVWVAPGVYSETVAMKSNVHLQGAGQDVTFISSNIGNASFPPTTATLVLASDTSLRDLTVENITGGGYSFNVALLATGGAARVLVTDVTVRAQGFETDNYAIVFALSGTEVTLQRVTALGENGSNNNYGLLNWNSAEATLREGSYTAIGGVDTAGINNKATMDALNVTALGKNGSNINTGFHNSSSATAMLQGGSFTGRGGSYTYGIYNNGSATTLDAENITVLAENGSTGNYGIWNTSGAATIFQSLLEGTSNSVYRDSGSITISHSKLFNPVFGTVTCVLVTRGTSVSIDGSTCP